MMEHKKVYEEWYKELRKQYTDEEIADAHLIPEDLSPEELQEAHEQIRQYRMERLKNRTEQDRLHADLMRLRILMNEYVQSGIYDENQSFGSYLEEYIRIIKKTKREFAEDVGLHYTSLSRIANDREDPNVGLMYRLEVHSGEMIPAVLWWKLLAKKQEHEVRENDERRAEEAKKVRNALQFRA